MIVYKRFWSEREMRSASPLVAALHREPSLFRFRASATEASAHGGPLSLKSVFEGQTAYRFGDRELRVTPDRVLVVPPGLRYATQVGQEGADIATFYFPAPLVADALSSLSVRDDHLLDGRIANPGIALDFPPHGRGIGPRMRVILSKLKQKESSAPLEDIGLCALEETLRFALEAKNALARLPASKPSVRRELFRRACAARDEIVAHPEGSVGLHELARKSFLSPFHLHRIFRTAFGETPARMQRRIRVERAQQLLVASESRIGEVARLVGFASESAFSRSFRVITGVSPRAYRHIRGLDPS